MALGQKKKALFGAAWCALIWLTMFDPSRPPAANRNTNNIITRRQVIMQEPNSS
jgi:hypothetical protein